jgi:hypothetical protein
MAGASSIATAHPARPHRPWPSPGGGNQALE